MPQIIDGYCGEPHVEAEDIWHSNVAICGPGLWRTDEGGQCNMTLANNNTITVADGIIIADGIRIRVPSPENISIANGVVGMNRIDLIILRYTKDPSTSIMSTEWKVIQGQSTAGTPEEPTYTPGDVLNGATVAEWVYSSVELNGLTVSQPEVRAKILKSYTERCDELDKAWDSLSQFTENVSGFTASSGWATELARVRRFGHVSIYEAHVKRTGSALAADTESEIGTLPPIPYGTLVNVQGALPARKWSHGGLSCRFPYGVQQNAVLTVQAIWID